MKLIISFAILLIFNCNIIKNHSKETVESEKKEPEILLLKVTWFEGEVIIIRDKLPVEVKENLEIEKEDLIKTGNDGSIELLLGLDHTIKLSNLSEISLTNLLTTEGDTATNISVFSGKVLTNISNDEAKNLITIMTPNAQANINNTLLVTEIISQSSKDTNCNGESSCNTKFRLLKGKTNIKQIGKNSEIVLNEKFQITISNKDEITQNAILPLEKNSYSEFNQLLNFHSEDQKLSEDIQSEYKSESKPKLVFNAKKSVKIKNPIPKIYSKTKISPKKIPTLGDPKDKLKLDSNKKF